MTRLAFAIPGDIATPTGGYAYDRRVLAGLGRHGIEARHLPLPGGFPEPDDETLAASRDLLRAVPAGDVLMVDGLAAGAMPPDSFQDLSSPFVFLCHHPLGLEAGLPAARARELIDNERAVLALAEAIVVTSAATGRLLARDFAVDEARIHVAEPGTEEAPRAPASHGEPRLLAVGSLVPRKGYLVMAEALAPLRDLPWTLTIVGAERAPGHKAEIEIALARAGIADRVRFAGTLEDDALGAAYREADLFVMPSLFEGFGMVLTEALARGLPIVATTGGAAAETVPDAAALKVPPGDAQALSDALRSAISDAGLRRRLADAAWDAAAALPRWDDTARRIAHVIRTVAGGRTR